MTDLIHRVAFRYRRIKPLGKIFPQIASKRNAWLVRHKKFLNKNIFLHLHNTFEEKRRALAHPINTKPSVHK